MGCGVSRIDANGLAIPVKLRPLFLSRLEEIISKSRHGRPLNDATPSKKELLLNEKDDDDYDHVLTTAPSSPKDTVADAKKIEDTKRIENENEGGVVTSLGKRDDNNHEVSREGSTKGNCKDVMKESMVEHMEAKEKDRLDNTLTDTENDDDDDGDIERMIGHKIDDDTFPGSPSFRVYFNDNEEDDHHDSGNHDVFKGTTSNDDTPSSKESSEKQKAKRGKKRRSFKLPKGGQVKNLLNVKSCYMPSHSAPPDRTHLLPAPKTTT